MTFQIRKATDNDDKEIANILGLAVKIDMPYLPVLHTEEEDLAYTQNTILKNYEVWVAQQNDSKKIIGFIAMNEGWVHQLYILKGYQGIGVGSQLIEKAKQNFDELQLWTFQKNSMARAFYEAKGFSPIKFTDGLENDEKEPDVIYKWTKKEATCQF